MKRHLVMAEKSLGVHVGLVEVVGGHLSPTWSRCLSVARVPSFWLSSLCSVPTPWRGRPLRSPCCARTRGQQARGPCVPVWLHSVPEELSSLFITSWNQRILEFKSQNGYYKSYADSLVYG